LSDGVFFGAAEDADNSAALRREKRTHARRPVCSAATACTPKSRIYVLQPCGGVMIIYRKR